VCCSNSFTVEFEPGEREVASSQSARRATAEKRGSEQQQQQQQNVGSVAGNQGPKARGRQGLLETQSRKAEESESWGLRYAQKHRGWILRKKKAVAQ